MLKPEEFLQAAREELGDERVNKILRINEAAAQRLAEYETATTAIASGDDHLAMQFPSWRGDDNTAAVAAEEGSSAPLSLPTAEAAENEARSSDHNEQV
jgi:hypothetical protein